MAVKALRRLRSDKEGGSCELNVQSSVRLGLSWLASTDAQTHAKSKMISDERYLSSNVEMCREKQVFL